MSTDLLSQACAVLEEHWGYSTFRKAQEQVLVNTLEGEDVLAVLPTGYGKSVCFQVPALMTKGVTVVISPLIALMKDQVDDCAKRGISASYINSHVDEHESVERMENLQDGVYKIFYIAPERIDNKAFMRALGNSDVARIVVDEAHCASQWGHDFRPAYMRIHRLTHFLTTPDGARPPVLCVTATATADIEDDIMQSVGIDGEYFRIVGDPIRPNLSYKVAQGNPWRNLIYAGKQFDTINGQHIVYVGTQKGASTVRDKLIEECDIEEDEIAVYHAGMNKDARNYVQDGFKSGALRVICATCAFGMGIDVPCIRTVIHFGIPGSLEDYVQEAGRAGRDGKPALVMLVSDEFSINLRQGFVDRANPPIKMYQGVWDFLQTLEPGEVLEMTGKHLAKDIFGIDPESRESWGMGEQISSVLSVLESRGVVDRAYLPASHRLSTNDGKWLKVLEQNHKPAVAKLIHAIDTTVVKPAQEARKGGGDLVTAYIDKSSIATIAGVSGYLVDKALKGLEKDGWVEVETAFKGKTTQLKRKGVGKKLEEVVDLDELKAKRNREQKRLNQMISYSEMRAGHTNLIKSYFLTGPEG